MDEAIQLQLSEVRMVIGTTTFGHALTKSQAASGENAYEYLVRVGGGVNVSAQLPAVAAKNQVYIRSDGKRCRRTYMAGHSTNTRSVYERCKRRGRIDGDNACRV